MRMLERQLRPEEQCMDSLKQEEEPREGSRGRDIPCSHPNTLVPHLAPMRHYKCLVAPE